MIDSVRLVANGMTGGGIKASLIGERRGSSAMRPQVTCQRGKACSVALKKTEQGRIRLP